MANSLLDIKVVHGREVVLVRATMNQHFPVGTAEASRTERGWYVNRVLVRTPEDRGKGIGSKMVAALLDGIRHRDPQGVVIVEPGGYGSDPERLKRFYQRCGFQEAGEWLEVRF